MNDLEQAAKLYASLGWHVLPVKGKMPCSGEGWQYKTSNSEDAAEVLATIGDGIGVQLGPKSGIVDVECDSEEAALELKTLLGAIPKTPTFQSSRGCHYLFRWSEAWPSETKAVFKIGAIEFRIGTAKAAQSVFPPSGGRKWIVDPSTPVAEFPAMEQVKEIYKANHKRKEFSPLSFSSPSYSDGETLDVPKWLSKHSIPIIGRDEIEGVTRWYIDCPGKHLHTSKDAVKDCCVTQEPNGKLGGHCFHQSCGMGSWENLRDAIGPLEHSDYANEEDFSDIDITGILNQLWGTKEQENADFENDSDEDFCRAMVPADGILRMVFDFYCSSAYRESSVMGLAVALSLCETIFGRRVRSQTDMRTNDYNLVLASTGSGKENCETTITKILNAADATGSHMLPPDIQSGNGLMHAIANNPCGIWVCDEFGKILQAVLDKKGNQHIKNIGNHLLKLYGKSAGCYGGAAHSQEVRNKVDQPHLVVLGLSTPSTVFDCVTSENVSDGLLGRIAFWPVQDRPEPKADLEIAVPSEALIAKVQSWIQFSPGSGNLSSVNPVAEVVKMSADAKARWQQHSAAIDERMRSEPESRAAVWARVAARSMKLALVHRCARVEVQPSSVCWDFVQVEIQDINWAIKLANWLAKIACGLVKENTVDKSLAKAKAILLKAIENGPASKRDILRMFRGISAGDLESAASELGLTIRRDKTKGRPKVFFEKPTNTLLSIAFVLLSFCPCVAVGFSSFSLSYRYKDIMGQKVFNIENTNKNIDEPQKLLSRTKTDLYRTEGRKGALS
jgi:hypothetical protein